MLPVTLVGHPMVIRSGAQAQPRQFEPIVIVPVRHPAELNSSPPAPPERSDEPRLESRDVPIDLTISPPRNPRPRSRFVNDVPRAMQSHFKLGEYVHVPHPKNAPIAVQSPLAQPAQPAQSAARPPRPPTGGEVDAILATLAHDGEAFTDFFLEHWQVLPDLRSTRGRPVLAELAMLDAEKQIDLLMTAMNARDHVNARAGDSHTALMHAVQRNSEHAVTKLLSLPEELVMDQISARQRQGANSLMMAARFGHLNLVRLLLSVSAPLQAQQLRCLSHQQENALMFAAYHGHLEVAQVLVEAAMHLRGHDNQPLLRQLLHQANDFNMRAIDLASHRGNQGLVQLLVQSATQLLES